MQWSVASKSAFYRGRTHLWIVFSFKLMEFFINDSLDSIISNLHQYIFNDLVALLLLSSSLFLIFKIIARFLFLRCLIPLRVRMEETTIIWSIVFLCRTAQFPGNYYKNVYICVHAQETQNVKNFLYLWPTILNHQYGSCVNWKQEMWSDVFFSTVSDPY